MQQQRPAVPFAVSIYEYNAAGDLIKEVSRSRTRTITYDSSGQVRAVTDGSTKYGYTYDAAGSMTKEAAQSLWGTEAVTGCWNTAGRLWAMIWTAI